MPIVTITRQFGSGGSEIAARVANALGWTLYDSVLVDQVASRLGMTVAAVSSREERLPSLSERLASAISLSVPEVMPSVGDVAVPPSEERIVEVTQRVIEEAVTAGPAVLVGRGAQSVLAARSDALHVFCYAPLESLVSYAMTTLGMERDAARKHVHEMNERRAQFIKRHWSREWGNPANYHLCVNTAWLGLDGAAELVTSVARERFG
jgi:cytidylate kinase